MINVINDINVIILRIKKIIILLRVAFFAYASRDLKLQNYKIAKK